MYYLLTSKQKVAIKAVYKLHEGLSFVTRTGIEFLSSRLRNGIGFVSSRLRTGIRFVSSGLKLQRNPKTISYNSKYYTEYSQITI